MAGPTPASMELPPAMPFPKPALIALLALPAGPFANGPVAATPGLPALVMLALRGERMSAGFLALAMPCCLLLLLVMAMDARLAVPAAVGLLLAKMPAPLPPLGPAPSLGASTSGSTGTTVACCCAPGRDGRLSFRPADSNN